MSDVAKKVLIAIGSVLVGIGLILGLFYGTTWFRQHTANTRGETSKRDLINANGAYRASSYDHFFNLCSTIQTDQEVIKNTQDELTGKPAPDSVRIQELRTNLQAQKSKLATDVNQYNVDTQKGYTEGQFRDASLPYHINEEEKVTCS